MLQFRSLSSQRTRTGREAADIKLSLSPLPPVRSGATGAEDYFLRLFGLVVPKCSVVSWVCFPSRGAAEWPLSTAAL